ncbi:hypothetical protein CHUAL_012081 [Chamberlinius hualienensis]
MANEKGVKEFLNKLILAVNQPSADDIEKYILDKNTTTKLNIFNDEVVVLGVKHEIVNWLRKLKNKKGWINGTNSSTVIHKTNAIVQKLVINEPFESKVKKCQINWSAAYFHQWTDIFSALKLYQILQSEENYNNDFIFTTNSYVTENPERIAKISSVISLLVIEYEKTSRSVIISIGQQLNKLLTINTNLKLIIIANTSLVKHVKLDQSISNVVDNFTWADLEDESKEQLLSSQISFQGKNVKLSDLINPEQLNDIDEESLAKFALKNKL